jgi:FkbM family methyltransferase
MFSLRCPPVRLHVHKNPWRLYREIFLYNCYQPLVPLGPRPRILDIGANIGLASLYFLGRWPDARLLAWEPNPAAFDLLKRNLTENEFPAAKIHIEAKALSDEDGAVEFAVPKGDPTAVYASIPREGTKADPPADRVQVQTVDAAHLFAEPVDLAKLDIEGQEYPVLENALPDASTIRALAIEFHRVHRHQEQVEDLLDRLLGGGGYRGVDRSGGPLEPDSLRGQRGSVLLRFCHRDS